jgi:transcriptional regulator with XRE-family HTH domain
VHVTRRDAKSLLTGIGSEIRHRRQKLGFSQDLLATKAGVHRNVVGRTERGIYNPTVMTLDAIAAALNTSMVELLRAAQVGPVPGTAKRASRRGSVTR